MKRLLLSTMVLCASCNDSSNDNKTSLVNQAGHSKLTVNFHGMFDDTELSCDQGVFTAARMFISNVYLVKADKSKVKLELEVKENSSNLQYVDAGKTGISLLNFIDSSCYSKNNVAIVKNSITGSIKKGNYTGLEFEIGIPYTLGSESQFKAIPASMQPSDMAWMWNHYPADFQFNIDGGKVINSLTTNSNPLVSLALNINATSDNSRTMVHTHFNKLIPASAINQDRFLDSALDYLSTSESSCNNKINGFDREKSPVCAQVYDVLGFSISRENHKAPSLFKATHH